jgi:hypothetical protein
MTVVDGLALIAATAIGLALIRAQPPYATPPSPLRTENWIYNRASCPVATWSATLALLAMRPPRPTLRRLTRQPGVTAGIVCLGIVAVSTVISLSRIDLNAPFSGLQRFDIIWGGVMFRIAYASVGSWVALALSGLWRPAPTWTDRLGRLAGCYWVAVVLLHAVEVWVRWILPAT